MNKAYDRIDWDFVKAVLLKMGFARNWVMMVMRCISSVEFAIVVNGKAGDDFKSIGGIRQGDPFSPYLLIISSDVLSSMLNHVVSRGILHGIKFWRTGLVLSHLFFADDCRVVGQILKSTCQL
ncbi:hypothetical protein CerSpe_172100 [Prunus speciosa]